MDHYKVCFENPGIGAMTWSPLACGIISGKYDNGIPPYTRASLKVTLWLLPLQFCGYIVLCPPTLFILQPLNPNKLLI